ncbi:hypothetical protein CEUSTIGMA_g12574.t1 [Chlamydomonas eustigma]|uniref:Uncharacterized protein n=1 Tax=Chlamydomonas eustigma TaxID=1157962 RepID=A0A250XQ38_9CHLO|nr:hypothetical protein CEUSTIGMA_g12574.t1 [Chlamydomonas eustigma]|eukprot:GAX85156.1 hypothetical protein CEUSTIGMA_g12574.t1 [Chlamydomonas eustigma]
MGPLYTLFNHNTLSCAFVNCCIDLAAALSKLLQLNIKELGGDMGDDLKLVLSQLQRMSVDHGVSALRTQVLTELKQLAEGFRQKAAGSKPLTDLDVAHTCVDGCSVLQLSSDLAYLQKLREEAVEGRKWVEQFFLDQLMDLVKPHVPALGKQQQQYKAQQLSEVIVSSVSPSKREAQQLATVAEASSGPALDPVVEVRALLDYLCRPNLSLELRLATLQPLVAAAGLLHRPVPPGSTLHSGAVLYALTDPQCAQQVVSIISGDMMPNEVKVWMLSLMLSLVHPEKGLNPDTQKALLGTGLPVALCRMLIKSTTPEDQRIQSLSMLRVLVSNKDSHDMLVEANVIPTLVKQIAEVVRLDNGRFIARPSEPPTLPLATTPIEAAGRSGESTARKTNTALPPTGAATPAAGIAPSLEAVPWDMRQQMTQLAILMLCDLGSLKGHAFKADILKAGGIVALVSKLTDPYVHQQIRLTALRALSQLLEDGAVAVEVARCDALPILVDMMLSTSIPQEISLAATAAVKAMLTPTEATSHATAAVALIDTGGTTASSSRGRSTQRINRSVVTASTSKNASREAAGEDDGGDVGVNNKVSMEALMEAMGHAFTPSATSALMNLLINDNQDMASLALDLLPLSATDSMCRTAIVNHTKGMTVLVKAAAQHKRNAIDTLARVAEDHQLKRQVATALGKEIKDVGTDLARGEALATAIAEIGTPPPGYEEDSVAAERSADFTSEVLLGGGLPMLLSLVKSSDAKAKMAGVFALRPMCLYGEEESRHLLLKADIVTLLVECTKHGDDLAQVACQCLSGMTHLPEARPTIFGSFVGHLSSSTGAGRACMAISLVAGSSSDCYLELEKEGAVQKVVNLISTVPPAELLPPVKLLCGLAKWSPSAGHKAYKCGACEALLSVMGRCDVTTRVACCACCGFLERHDEKARNELAGKGLVEHLFQVVKEAPSSTPMWEDAMVTLSTMATLHHGSRSDAAATLKSLLERGGPSDVTAAAVVLSYPARGNKGRDLVLSGGLDEPLIKKALAQGTPRAQAAAADAIGFMIIPPSVTLLSTDGKDGKPKVVNPKQLFVNKGAVQPLIQLLGSEDEACVFAAADTLDTFAGCEEGLQAISKFNGQSALQEVIGLGKKGRVSKRTALAANNAYMKCVGR